ncbi:MAG: NAD+ synthase [Planctomycetota bacterium]|nr:MAG: NAD+ synthase [Planctomycetota bacterium]
MRIALAQINPTVGDFEGNAARIERAYRQARSREVDLVALPELAVCGYPPRDLLERSELPVRCREVVDRLARLTRDGPALVVGFVDVNESNRGNPIHNAAAFCAGGEVRSLHRKSLLPTYDVFDEGRYFEPAREVRCAQLGEHRIAITICEDIWLEDYYWQGRRYGRDPLETLLAENPVCLLNISASPWRHRKTVVRHTLLRRNARRLGRPALLVNQVGGNDDLIFDGSSIAIDGDGSLLARARSFEPDCIVVDLARREGEIRPEPPGGEAERTVRAIELGLRDYLEKTGAGDRVVLGVSGGIDSALVATIAARALGPERVLGVRMPSRFSSPGSLIDAERLAHNLGIGLETVPITEAFETVRASLAPLFGERPFDVTEENLQARLRGLVLMAISNKLGPLVLNTGNKSELAVGYCTLYGDMVGALAPIGDVWKTEVYELAAHLNREHACIPRAILEKPPSAELRPGQTDRDSLPPYEVLDPILRAYIEHNQSVDAIAQQGHERSLVERVVGLVDRAEYKRRQAPPVLRVSSKAFGLGRRLPIAHRYRP